MKALKTSELRDKDATELQAMALGIRQELFLARRDLVFRKTTDTTGLKVRRHNIARILTVLAEKQKGNA